MEKSDTNFQMMIENGNMSKKIVIELSDKAYNRLKEIADINEISVEEESFGYNEKWLNNATNEQFQKKLKSVKKYTMKKKEEKWFSKYPMQSYILQKYKNGVEKILEWRTGRIPEYSIHPYFYDKRGMFYCKIHKEKPSGIFTTQIKDSEKYYTFKTLKALKRKVNSLFGYEHYKVK